MSFFSPWPLFTLQYTRRKKHGISSYDRGCRCQVCKEAQRAARRARIARGPSERTVHGTPSAYSNYGCRCEPCREVWAAYMRKYNAKRRLQDKVDHRRG